MIAFALNGEDVRCDAAPATRLSEVLRGQLGQMGTKSGCDAGDCGACTVLIDGEPACACLVSAAQADGARITTIEGLKASPRGALLQQAFLARGAAQCGICTPGMLVAAVALLEREAAPTRSMIEDALGGVHTADVLGAGEVADEQDLLAARGPGLGVRGAEDDAAGGGAGAGRQALGLDPALRDRT